LLHNAVRLGLNSAQAAPNSHGAVFVDAKTARRKGLT